MPPAIQRDRLAFYASNRLSRGSRRSGLLGYDKKDTGLATWATRLCRCLVPIEDHALGLRIAGNAADIVTECHARLAEVLQIEQSPTSLRVDLGPTGRSAGFRAIPKGRTAESDFLLTQKTVRTILALAREIGRRQGNPQGVLSAVGGARNVARKVSGPRPFVFQWNGRALSPDALNFMLGILGSGFGRISMHILRHASANAKVQRQVPRPHIQRLLGHEDERITDPYIAATPRQAALMLLREHEEATVFARTYARKTCDLNGESV